MLALTLVPLLLQSAQPSFPAPVRELRDAADRFESVRRMNLPVEHGRGGPCEARIGRFCYWSDSTPPPATRAESPRVAAERGRLLDRLADAAGRWPSDPWIAGQRVRYLIEGGQADSAAALPCEAVGWWCAALRGLALHVAARDVAADSAFAAALRAMPAEVRCDWTNLEIVLENAPAREFERADCATRERLAGVAWRLAQPLWMLGGNDARAEHLSRHVMAVILAESATPHATRWGPDMRELLLRYGWAERYTRSPPTGVAATSWSVLGHDREPNWNVMPRLKTIASPWVARDAWELRMSRARMRYAPRGVSALLPLPHQLARIPRGDSMEVVVVAPLRSSLGDSVDAAVAVLRDEILTVRAMEDGAATFLMPFDTMVVSVEARDRQTRRAARERYSLAPLQCARGTLCLSDLLLYEGEGNGESLSLVVSHPLGERVAPGEPIGVWWLVEGTPGTVTVTAEVRAERSAARRGLERVRLAPRGDVTRLRWELPMHGGILSSSVALRLPASARGRHRIIITARVPGAAPVSSSRSIVVSP